MDRGDLVLAALAAGGVGASYSPVQVQKLLFLIDREAANLVDGPHFSFRPYDYGPFEAGDLAFRHRGGRRHAAFLTREAALAAKITLAQDRDHGFLAMFGQDSDLDLALLDEEHAVRNLALHEDRLPDVIGRDAAPLPDIEEKSLRIERCGFAGLGGHAVSVFQGVS